MILIQILIRISLKIKTNRQLLLVLMPIPPAHFMNYKFLVGLNLFNV